MTYLPCFVFSVCTNIRICRKPVPADCLAKADIAPDRHVPLARPAGEGDQSRLAEMQQSVFPQIFLRNVDTDDHARDDAADAVRVKAQDVYRVRPIGDHAEEPKPD